MAVDTLGATAAAGVDPSRRGSPAPIKQAANNTGASFEYLLATAKMESNFNPKAAATTSSARGLFQFIDQTWLGTVKEAGSQLGYGKYADAISKSSSGGYYVNDPSMRGAIMKLRDDPNAASSMAAVLTQSNSFKLTGKIGRRPSDSELYMAHFMGVGGAGKLISNAENSPNASAARLFPNAAAANRSIFYDRAGRGAQRFRGLFGADHALCQRRQFKGHPHRLRGGRRRRSGVAWRSPARARRNRRLTIDNAAYLSSVPDSRSVTPVKASAQADLKTASLPQQAPIFRSLFQAGERSQPISPAVQELWGNSSSLTSSVTIASPIASLPTRAPEVRAPGRLDLFSDRFGTFS